MALTPEMEAHLEVERAFLEKYRDWQKKRDIIKKDNRNLFWDTQEAYNREIEALNKKREALGFSSELDPESTGRGPLSS